MTTTVAAEPSPEGRAQHAEAIEALALMKLFDAMGGYGNQLGATHMRGLRDFLRGMAWQLTRIEVGLWGYPLTCGAGKTQGLVALLAAVYELGLPYSVVVAAQKVADLAKIRRDLRIAGVPAELVGLIHSKSPGSVHNDLADATPSVLPEDCTSTDNGDRQFLLATHEMLRRHGREDGIVTMHGSQRRDLMVWDETLLLSEVGAVSVKKIERAANGWSEAGKQFAYDFLHSVAVRAGAEMCRQVQLRARPEPFTIECDPALEEELRELVGAVRWSDEYASADAKYLGAVLDLIGCDVAVAVPGRGSDDALIHRELVIGPGIDNIAVLDASHVVRRLGRIGVKEAASDAMRACKRYDDCTATTYRLAASKDAQSRPQKLAKVAALVARIIDTVPGGEGILVFTFKVFPCAARSAPQAPSPFLAHVQGAQGAGPLDAGDPNQRPRGLDRGEGRRGLEGQGEGTNHEVARSAGARRTPRWPNQRVRRRYGRHGGGRSAVRAW